LQTILDDRAQHTALQQQVIALPELDIDLARQFLIALLIGALVGAEREKSQSESGHRTFAGLRTFILLAELGAVAAWLSRETGNELIVVLTLTAVSVALVAAYVLESRQRPESIGLSTEIAALCVFLLGAIVAYGHAEIAIALGVVTAALLAFKQSLHGMIRRIGTDDLYAVLTLLIATFIILPMLPDHTVDPWGALNPYTLWLLVILISGLSLVGYVAVRLLGPSRGTVITGLAGGLVSSTAVTLAFARQSRELASRVNPRALAAGVVGAWTIMFIRVLITVAVVKPALVMAIAIEFSVLAIVGILVTAWLYRRSIGESSVSMTANSPAIRNPFSLLSAIQFALLFAAMLVIVKLTGEYAPEGGLYLVSILAGLTDVDAITLSVAQSAGSDIPFDAAMIAVMLASLANTATKCTMVLVLGRGEIRTIVLLTTVGLFLAGFATAFLTA